jgi:AcrR family transcriptional regulator
VTAGEQPARTPRSARAGQVVAAARAILEAEGPGALTMRRLGADLGMQAPSLYKHVPDKAFLEAALVEEALVEMGSALHAALAATDGRTRLDAVLAAYRRTGLSHPHLYRLATSGSLPRDLLPAGLEAWAGEPFFHVTGEPHVAQALWSFAHGMVDLEIDDRFPAGSDLDRTWRAGAVAFSRGSRRSRPA